MSVSYGSFGRVGSGAGFSRDPLNSFGNPANLPAPARQIPATVSADPTAYKPAPKLSPLEAMSALGGYANGMSDSSPAAGSDRSAPLGNLSRAEMAALSTAVNAIAAREGIPSGVVGAGLSALAGNVPGTLGNIGATVGGELAGPLGAFAGGLGGAALGGANVTASTVGRAATDAVASKALAALGPVGLAAMMAQKFGLIPSTSTALFGTPTAFGSYGGLFGNISGPVSVSPIGIGDYAYSTPNEGLIGYVTPTHVLTRDDIDQTQAPAPAETHTPTPVGIDTTSMMGVDMGALAQAHAAEQAAAAQAASEAAMQAARSTYGSAGFGGVHASNDESSPSFTGPHTEGWGGGGGRRGSDADGSGNDGPGDGAAGKGQGAHGGSDSSGGDGWAKGGHIKRHRRARQ